VSEQDAAIRIPKAAELVADTLRRRIVTGDYEADELLPPEGTLMSTFNVARTTIRDAFRMLESEGLIVVRRGAGGGARVRPPGIGLVADYAGVLLQYRGATLEDVHMARILVETPAARLLAESSDKEKRAILESLRAALAEETAAMSDPTALTKAEGHFHRLIVELTGNDTLLMLSAVANRIIAEQVARDMGAKGQESTAKHYKEAHRAHERLVDLIAVGASQEAETLWRRHLEGGLAHLASGDKAAKTVLDVMS
jgi:DNA-binding FadR family transcriptional regulator